METKIRILLADANPDFSKLLADTLAAERDLELIGTDSAPDGPFFQHSFFDQPSARYVFGRVNLLGGAGGRTRKRRRNCEKQNKRQCQAYYSHRGPAFEQMKSSEITTALK